MKTWVIEKYGDVDGLAQVDWPQPVPAAGEVLIRVKAVSLNYRDLGTLRHERPGNLPPPLIPCSDGASEVVALGDGCTQFKIGDRVVGTFFRDWIDGPFQMEYHKASGGGSIHGVLCEYISVPEHALLLIPKHLSFEEAATLPVAGVTAWASLFSRGQLKAGATVLTLGTGGVSIFALQLSVAAGARVVVTSSRDEKLERAKALGAWETVNYKTTPDWEKEVWRMTEKRGVDHVIEVGGPGTLDKSIACIAGSGQIALIGVLTGFGPPTGSLFPLMARNARIDGIYAGSRDDFMAFNAFLETHQLHPIIDRVFPFDEARDAFTYLASGAHFGKVAITI